MKNIVRIALFGVLLLATTECTELELQNPNKVTEESFYKNDRDAVSGVNAAYATLQKLSLYGSGIMYHYDMRADDMEPTGNNWGEFRAIANFTYNNTTPEIYNLWKFLYEGVFRCNALIDKLPDIDWSANPTRKDWLEGEVKFLRGFYYYHLVLNFGEEIPLFTSVAAQNNIAASKAPEGAIYQQIISDWNEAKQLLPTSSEWPNADKGRATKGAAQAFLGKLYMIMGQYENAKAELKAVIDSQQYELVADYYSNFTDENENNKESIFQIQFRESGGNQWGGLENDDPNATEGTMVEFLYGNPQGGSGWNLQPSDQLVNKFEENPKDPRKDATVFYQGGVNYDPTGLNQPWTRPVGEYGNRKYFKNAPNPARGNGNIVSGVNIRVMRYAEVLLLYAEALNETGNQATALEYINLVRARVGMPPYLAADYPTQADVFEAIMHETMVEFGGEQLRWINLVRWDNNGKIDMTPYIKSPTNDPGRGEQRQAFNKAIHKYYPIPLKEIEVNPNLAN